MVRSGLWKLALISSIFLLGSDASPLQYGFYGSTCPQAETVALNTLKTFLAADPTLAGALLRISYHDCFVRGCDASLLLNSTNGATAEKDAPGPNLNSVRGYEAIDGIKAALECECPGVVSCADIVQIVSRDVTAWEGGPWWEVQLGRRDGRISVAKEAQDALVGPGSNYTVQKDSFASKGLSEKDLVVLSGAHTIGRSRCTVIESRIYNFSGTGQADPALDRSFVRELKSECPIGSSNHVPLDGTQFAFDSRYFKRLKTHKGLFSSDNAFITEPFPASIVALETKKKNFFVDFPEAMLKMAAIEVLTGTDGEIRKHCAFVN